MKILRKLFVFMLFFSPVFSSSTLDMLDFGEHILQFKTGDGKAQIEDGFVFKAISDSDKSVLSSWSIDESITINLRSIKHDKPNLEIINQSNREYITVQLQPKPLGAKFIPFTLRHFDPHDLEIIVKKGGLEHSFQAQIIDKETLFTWAEGDRVTIGINDSHFFKSNPSYPFVLINYDKYPLKCVVRVREFSDFTELK